MPFQLATSMRQEHRLSMEIALTQSQRMAIQTRLLALRLELIDALHELKYNPTARCPMPGCGYELKPLEILQGFVSDPTDFDTTCPQCGHRFGAKLIAYFRSGRVEFPFFCATQTLAQLRGKEGLSYDELDKHHGALLHSATVHFGNIKAAFAKIGADYPIDIRLAWKEKIKPFLGMLPDPVIAEVVGVKKGVIARYRCSLQIKGFKQRKLLE